MAPPNLAVRQALARSPFAVSVLERMASSEKTLSSGQASVASLSPCMSRQSSAESGSWQPSCSRSDAKAINSRLMQAQSTQEIFNIVVEHLPQLDSINVTAALQRLAKFLANDDHHHGGGNGGGGSGGRGQGLKEAVLASPVFQALAGMMVEQCNSGCFNAQSTANAWWAVAKLHAAEHPASVEMVGALENALIACLTTPINTAKPNAQGVSSVWYSCGRLATDGYLPSARAMQLMWQRTQQLSLSFDSQGVANMLWAFGQLRKKHGESFPVPADVLASLHFVVARIAGSFAVQGLSCSAVGCANLGGALRASVLPLMHILIAESTRRYWQFNLQAMANMASAISRMGKELVEAEGTRALLTAFDGHAASLPPNHRAQEASVLCSALRSCGVAPLRFMQGQGQGGAQSRLPPSHQEHARRQQQKGGLRDATNSSSWSAGSASGAGGSGIAGREPAATACLPFNQLAMLSSLAGRPPPPPRQPWEQYQQQVYQQQQEGLASTPLPAGAAPSMPAHLTFMVPPGLPLSGSGPLSISEYALLAQQLSSPASRRPTAPAAHQVPLPVMLAPFPMPLSLGAPPFHPQWQGSNLADAAAAAPTPPSTTSDPAHLQRILAALQMKLQANAATGSRA